MLRRKELVEQIKVMKEAQKIIKRDPDLMQIMNININDSEIAGTSHQQSKSSSATSKETSVRPASSAQSTSVAPQPQQNTQINAQANAQNQQKKGAFGNLFGKQK